MLTTYANIIIKPWILFGFLTTGDSPILTVGTY